MTQKEKELTERLVEPKTEKVWDPADAGKFNMDKPEDQEAVYGILFAAINKAEETAEEKAYERARVRDAKRPAGTMGGFELKHGLKYGVRRGG